MGAELSAEIYLIRKQNAFSAALYLSAKHHFCIVYHEKVLNATKKWG